MTFFELTNFVLKKFSTTTFFYSHALFFMIPYSDLIVLIHMSGQNQANHGQKTLSKNYFSRHLDNLRQTINKFNHKHLFISLLRFYYVSLLRRREPAAAGMMGI
jgi:hypothetical protein